MAFTNLSGDPKQTSIEELVCSTEFTTENHNHLIVLLVLHSFVAITAFLGNSLILVALHKESSLHPPSKLLFRNLATTDLCVGIIAEPLCVTCLISSLKERWDSCLYALVISGLASYILCGVSLFTLAAISVDRLLALLLGLRYRQVITLKRIYLIVTLSWVVAAVGSTMYFWNYRMILWFGFGAVPLCVVVSTFSYTKISLNLRHNQVQAQGHVNQGQPSQMVPLNIARYKRTVSSVLWVQLILAVCYLPFAVVEVLFFHKGVTSDIIVAKFYLAALVYLNSSLSPIFYCWKIREVRQAVKDTIRGLFS